MRERYGALGGVVLAMSAAPQHERAWARGAEGEAKLAQKLTRWTADAGAAGPHAEVPVRPVLCFVDADRPLIGRLEVRGVPVLPPPQVAPIEPSAERRVVSVPALPERRLYLLRHAKSSWKEQGLADHDRPLAGRGRRAAKAIGRHLREQGVEPELVLCSSATRARETLERIEPALGRGAVRVEPELYGAGPAELLAYLHEIAPPVRSVMVIGHNPALEELALLLARRGSSRVRELEAKLPTGALATLAFRGPGWAALDRGTAELIAFIRPRDLES